MPEIFFSRYSYLFPFGCEVISSIDHKHLTREASPACLGAAGRDGALQERALIGHRIRGESLGVASLKFRVYIYIPWN